MSITISNFKIKISKAVFVFFVAFVTGFWASRFLLTLTYAQSATAAVFISPVTQLVNQGDQANVEVRITGGDNLAAYQFDLNFDPAVVQLVSATNGGFLGSTGRTVVPLTPIIDNSAGTATIGAISFGDSTGPQGDGVLAVLTFSAETIGSTQVGLGNVILLDTNVNSQPNTFNPGTIEVVSSQAPSPTPVISPSATPLPSSLSTPLPTASPTAPAPTPAASPLVTPQPTAVSSPTPVVEVTPLPSPNSPSPSPAVSPTPAPATEIATLSLTGVSPQIVGEEFAVDLGLETLTQIVGVDAVVVFDPRRLNIVGVEDGHLLPTTPKVETNNGDGTMRLSQLAQPGTTFSGNGILATLRFRGLVTGQSAIAIDYLAGSKAESNVIAASGSDILALPVALDLEIVDEPTLQLILRTYSENAELGHSLTGETNVPDSTWSAILNTDASGLSEIVGLEQGFLGRLTEFLFKAAGYLTERFSLTVGPGLNSVDLGLLKAGDLNDDGIINTLDLSLMYDGWFAAGSGDFNHDGVTNSADYWVLTQNFLAQDE